MKELTINQAMSKRAELEKLYNIAVENVQSIYYNTIIKNKELSGEEFLKHEIQNFDKEFQTMIALSEEIDYLKTEIARKNSIAKVSVFGEEMTIQKCLNMLATYRKRVDIIRRIIKVSKESEERRVDASGTTPYYVVVKANYNKLDMQENLENLNKKIMEMELAIDEANNRNVIYIP